MKVWLLTIGDEILIGQITDTNSTWMSTCLNLHGYRVIGKSSVGDTKEAIREGISYALTQADVVITTGGLGPTKDDITKRTLAEMFHSDMSFHQDTYETIAAYFARLNRTMPASMRDQATLPTRAQILPNKVGSAPGMLFEDSGKLIICLPGVPFEMEHLMQEQVIPALSLRYRPLPIVHRTVLTSMEGESAIAKRLEAFEDALPNHIKLAYLPGLGIVKLRLSAFGEDYGTEAKLTEEVEFWKARMIEQVGNLVFGEDRDTLAEVIGKMLLAAGKKLALAESCTGGSIAQQITLIPGASGWFEGGVVSYSNELKNKLLGVPKSIFRKVGAVSPECVAAMAEGARARLGADIALSVSGILGPDGGTPEKPVGTVYIGISDGHRTETYLARVARDRAKNMQLVSVYALTFLFRFLKT